MQAPKLQNSEIHSCTAINANQIL